jgi:hypothetical protein
MAIISIKNIATIDLTSIAEERSISHRGRNALHPDVYAKYLDKGYHKVPKSQEEATIAGTKVWNGPNASFPIITSENTADGVIIHATIMPTRYLVGQAMRDLVNENTYSNEQIQEMSPNMANVSLILPVKHKGQYFILGQLKGKALGEGQIHAAITAGNVAAEYLSKPNPLVTALRAECTEELGLELDTLSPGSFTCMIDESETGQVNFAAVSKIHKLETVLHSYDSATRTTLTQDANPEVMGLARLPIEGLVLIPAESSAGRLKNVTCYKPTSDGLQIMIEDRHVRPYTQAVAGYLTNTSDREAFMRKVLSNVA